MRSALAASAFLLAVSLLAACGADEGWKPVDPKHIALQGMACMQFKSDPSVFLDARFPCGVVQPD